GQPAVIGAGPAAHTRQLGGGAQRGAMVAARAASRAADSRVPGRIIPLLRQRPLRPRRRMAGSLAKDEFPARIETTRVHQPSLASGGAGGWATSAGRATPTDGPRRFAASAGPDLPSRKPPALMFVA